MASFDTTDNFSWGDVPDTPAGERPEGSALIAVSIARDFVNYGALNAALAEAFSLLKEQGAEHISVVTEDDDAPLVQAACIAQGLPCFKVYNPKGAPGPRDWTKENEARAAYIASLTPDLAIFGPVTDPKNPRYRPNERPRSLAQALPKDTSKHIIPPASEVEDAASMAIMVGTPNPNLS